MFDNNAQDFPAQKRRRVMAVADGFERQKPDGPKAPVQVPRFTSAFSEKQPHLTRNKPFSKPKFGPNSEFVTVSNPQSQSVKQLSVPAFLISATEKESVPSTRLRSLPDPRTFTNGETSSGMTPQLRPLPRPLPLSTPLQHVVTLKNMSTPMIFAPTETSIEASMRAISTNNITLATDLLMDSGTAELAHTLLHPDIAASNERAQPKWNVAMSPPKDGKYTKGKGKDDKFLKGGLAARSSELLAQSRISLILWQKEMELQFSAPSACLNADLRFRILKITDVPAGTKSSSPRKLGSFSSAVSIGTALCRIITTSTSHPYVLDTVQQTRENQSHFVVLSFPTIAPPRLRVRNGIYVRHPEDFIVGHELHVWKPWHEVSLCPTRSPLSFDDVTVPKTLDHESVELSAVPFPSIPLTYPRPLSSEAAEERSRPSDIVFLCSRFVIVP